MMFMRTLFKSVYSRKNDSNEFHLLRKFELWEMLLRMKEKNSVIHVNTAYKQKTNKIQSVNLEKITSETSDELMNWQKILWAWQMKHSKLIKSDSSHQYDAYIILRFLTHSWDFQLTSEQIKQLKINSELTSNKWEFLLKILMRWEKCLVWNMSELNWIHSEVTSLQKIWTISYKAWQTSSFFILKNLLKTIIKIL